MFVEKHGLSRTKIYKVWKSMRGKCYSSNKENHHKKGDIWVCDEWKDDPVAFVNWAKENGYEEGLQLVRKDKEDGYHPENCAFLKIEEACKTHGMRKTRLYNIWTQMIQRCTNQNLDHYARYGGRGITVCDEWKDFKCFVRWANQNGYNDGLTIDRINVDGNYEPGNCKWSTDIEQARNKRTSRYITINEETKTLAEWAEISGLPYKTIQRRLYTGCEEELLAPIGSLYKHKYLIEINGEKKTMNQWAKEAGMCFSTLKRRYQRGIRGEDLLNKERLNKKQEIQLSFDL
ncbi:hypothetical protein [Salimicrobium halophilum]|uniref:Uncharacterized protein n=1 Tax=Salimicrobium halophilum TaxID=86666 RepID=A0A1G8SEA9_9BACI|nr:hypothetical protein [Salimicrobium halophilum]SDJ27527.1 hypothetical protein SAMN04490247_1411 [Salimicrobium halophilum]